VTGSAVGADAIAQEIAEQQGLEIVAVLPQAIERYREDFAVGPEREALEARLGRCRRVLVADDAEGGYAGLGWFLASSCPVLIAVWDGKGLDEPTVPRGGTSHVVRMRLGRDLAPAGRPWREQPDPGPLVVVRAGRHSTPTGDEAVVGWFRRDGQGGMTPMTSEDPWWSGLAGIDRLDSLLGCSAIGGVGDAIDGIAGAAAARCRVGVRMTAWVLLGGVAALLVGAHHLVHAPLSTVLIGSYLAMLAAALLVHRFSVARQTGWALCCRALAEGLRTQAAWLGASIARGVHERYATMHTPALDWVRWALTGLHVIGSIVPTDAQGWVDGQLAYFRRAAQREAHRHHAAEQHVLWLAGASIATTVAAMCIPETLHGGLTRNLEAAPVRWSPR
jgi:hypothetical protein